MLQSVPPVCQLERAHVAKTYAKVRDIVLDSIFLLWGWAASAPRWSLALNYSYYCCRLVIQLRDNYRASCIIHSLI